MWPPDTKIIYIILLLWSMVQVTNAQTYGSKRVALVIGAQNYSTLPPLRNSINDAKAMAGILREKGFSVNALYDPKTKREIKDALNQYFNQMRDEEAAVGIIYYAGHGMQFEGENYLIPTGAALQNPGDLDEYCVKMNAIMAILKSASKSLNILLLDACRSLPSFTRDTEQGLTRVDAPQGAIIVFATQPGKVASDGTGDNGLFTSKLLKVINEPNLNITDVFKKVKQEVYAESRQSQLPSVEDNSIGGDFYFTPGKVESTQGGTKPVSILSESTAIKNDKSQSDFDKQFPPVNFGYGVSTTKVVTIGKQQWASKNLNTETFANGNPITHAKSDNDWLDANAQKQPAWCYYNNDPRNEVEYGKLYNWYAVTDARGLCPAGWKVPSKSDWTDLGSYGGQGAGKLLKASTFWMGDGNGVDAYYFSALPGGGRYHEAFFGDFGRYGYWWSSTSVSEEKSYSVLLSEEGENLQPNYIFKGNGFSVRCIKMTTRNNESR